MGGNPVSKVGAFVDHESLRDFLAAIVVMLGAAERDLEDEILLFFHGDHEFARGGWKPPASWYDTHFAGTGTRAWVGLTPAWVHHRASTELFRYEPVPGVVLELISGLVALWAARLTIVDGAQHAAELTELFARFTQELGPVDAKCFTVTPATVT